MSSVISPYRYSPLLPGPGSIRLLRLEPPEEDAASIKCQLFNYSLDESDKKPPQYEALSYVWGDSKRTLPIFIDGQCLNVTENLYAALRSLRDRSVKWMWIDAICINQQDRQERGHQVRSMAKIYGQANRVVVWLGDAADNSERAFEEICARRKWIDTSDYEIVQHAVLALLQRPWFRRIWILQEVAAARRVLVVCGSVQISGYAFCLGLKELEYFYKPYLELHNLIRSVTYLIRQADFRPTSGISWSDMSFLAVRPLGELLDMFHAHEATERHDKVYALLGMSSDARYAVDLLPDYDIPWGQVFRRLIQFLLGKRVSLETWDNEEIAVIKSKGFIIGQVLSVAPYAGWGDTHKVDITSKNTTTNQEFTRDWYARLTLQNSAKSILPGDLVYLPEGAPRPIIIRICKDHFAIITITAAPPEYIRTESELIRWSELLQSVTTLPHDLLLIWDWKKTPELPEEYEAPLKVTGQMQEHLKTEWKATRLENMALVLEDLNEHEGAKERLREVIKINEGAFGKGHASTLTSMYKLASRHKNQGRWKEAEELEMQMMETSSRMLGEEHPDTLIIMTNLASTFWNQGRWEEAEQLGVRLVDVGTKVFGEEHPDTLINLANLASTYRSQGRWEKAEKLYMRVLETCSRVLGEEHPDTLTSMNNLAITWKDQGFTKRAISLMKTCFRLRVMVLGPRHPLTISTREALATWELDHP